MVMSCKASSLAAACNSPLSREVKSRNSAKASDFFLFGSSSETLSLSSLRNDFAAETSSFRFSTRELPSLSLR